MPATTRWATGTVAQEQETSMPCPRPPSERQPDLFAPKDPAPPMVAAARRTELLPLVSALLAEVLAVLAAGEARDEGHT
jgi:hypothetical protein